MCGIMVELFSKTTYLEDLERFLEELGRPIEYQDRPLDVVRQKDDVELQMEKEYFNGINLEDYVADKNFSDRVERLRLFFDALFKRFPHLEDCAARANEQKVFEWRGIGIQELPDDLPKQVPGGPLVDPDAALHRNSFVIMYQIQLIMNTCFKGGYDIPEKFYENKNRHYLTRAAEKFLVRKGIKNFVEKDG